MKSINKFLVWVGVFFIFQSNLCATNNYIWWEAEDYETSSFPSESWFSASTFPETSFLLSQNDWLTVDENSAGKKLFAKYKVEIPEEGMWNLWTRKFWKHGPFKWRFDDSEWSYCGNDCALADSVTFRQFLCANWVFLGKVNLSKGSHSFEILLDDNPKPVAGFDCFLLIKGPFVARGKLKPDERSGKKEKGYFSWEPYLDPFTDDALLDLRYLNEQQAGEKGFVRITNSNFITADSKPLKLFGVNLGYENLLQDRDSIDYLAKILAKKGVNAVRVHGSLWSPTNLSCIDKEKLSSLHYAVYAFKKQGIYTHISLYFPLWLYIKPEYGIEGYDTIENKFPFGLIFFEPKLRSYYQSWLNKIFLSTNSFTGLSLAEDPAVVLVELVNEDSLFFWTFSKSNFPEKYWNLLTKLFGEWLNKRYGSLEKILSLWKTEKLKEDNPLAKTAGLYDIWHLTGSALSSASPVKKDRLQKQAVFMAELQKNFYLSMKDYLRNTLKVKSLIVPSNWITADEKILTPIEEWTYTAGDVIDRHYYFQGKHTGEGADWSVRVNHKYEDRSVLFHPAELPFKSVAVSNMPQIVSEFAWNAPNRFRTEGVILASLFGSIQNYSGFFFFAVGNNYLNDSEISKWPVGSPATAGLFPASSLIFRKNLIKPIDSGKEIISLDDLFNLKGSLISDYRLFLKGRVKRIFSSEKSTLSLYSNFNEQEITFNTNKGIILVNSPFVQLCLGFLKDYSFIKLDNIELLSDNEYGSLICVPLDDNPLSSSKKILLQVMTQEKMFGFSSKDGIITSIGEAPYNVKEIKMKVTIKNLKGTVKRIVPLDENGYIAKKPPVKFKILKDSVKFSLFKDILYYIIEI